MIKRDRSKVKNFINECKEILNRQSTSSLEPLPVDPETTPINEALDLPEIIHEKEDLLDSEIQRRKDRLELLSNEIEQDNLDGDIANIR